MPNSRGAYLAKKDLATGGTENVTFTPVFGCNTFQFRFITNDDAQLQLAVQTQDEDADLIHVDGSPFVQADGDFDSNGELEIQVDSANPAMKVTISGAGATATVKCKAYRSLDDATNPGSYSTTLGMS